MVASVSGCQKKDTKKWLGIGYSLASKYLQGHRLDGQILGMTTGSLYQHWWQPPQKTGLAGNIVGKWC
jgi:hypothetical protein